MFVPMMVKDQIDESEEFFEAGVTFFFSDMDIPDELIQSPLFWLAAWPFIDTGLGSSQGS